MKRIKITKKLSRIVKLDQKMKALPKLSPIENNLIETEQRFEATYYSNKLEGNRLDKHEARKAILSE